MARKRWKGPGKWSGVTLVWCFHQFVVARVRCISIELQLVVSISFVVFPLCWRGVGVVLVVVFVCEFQLRLCGLVVLILRVVFDDCILGLCTLI